MGLVNMPQNYTSQCSCSVWHSRSSLSCHVSCRSTFLNYSSRTALTGWRK